MTPEHVALLAEAERWRYFVDSGQHRIADNMSDDLVPALAAAVRDLDARAETAEARGDRIADLASNATLESFVTGVALDVWEADLTAERALADRLAEALERYTIGVRKELLAWRMDQTASALAAYRAARATT